MKVPRWKNAVFFGGIATAVLIACVLIRDALAPIAVSFFLAYLLDPVVDAGEKRKVPRWLTSGLLLIVVGGALALAVIVVIPALQKEAQKFMDNMPRIVEALSVTVLPAAERLLGRKIPLSIQDILNEVSTLLPEINQEMVRPMAKILAGAFAGIMGFLTGLLALILIPVLTYFFLRDFNVITARIAGAFPRPAHAWLVDRFHEVDAVLGGFVRGQLTVCLILAVLYSVGLTVIGIDLSVLIGTIGGLGFIIPFAGAALAATLSLLMSLVTFGPDIHLLYVLGLFVTVNLCESYVITPNIVGQKVGLNALSVIMSLYIGGKVLGIAGLLVAVPTAAVLKVFLRAGMDAYLRSPYYRGR